MGSIPGLGRSPGEGNSNPLQYSCLVNSMESKAWQATFYVVAKSWTWLNTHTPLLRRQTVYVTCFQRLTLAWLLTSSIKFYSLGPFPVFKSMRRSFLLLWPSWEGWLQQTVQHQLHHLHPCAFHKGMGPMHDAYRVHQWCLQSAHRLFLGNSESKQN